MLKKIQPIRGSIHLKYDALIDQFSLIYLAEHFDNWDNNCEDFIKRLENTFLNDFNKSVIAKDKNYNVVYQYLYGANNDLVTVSYDTNRVKNGIRLFVSGEGFKSIQGSTGLSDYEVIQEACALGSDNGFLPRLSRIDLTIDLFNYPFNIDKFIGDMRKGKISSKTVKNRPSTSKKYSKGDAKLSNGQFIYGWLGSSSSGNSFLRYYDKKREQEDKNGSRLAFANSLDSWSRFEYEVRGKKAHAVLDEVLNISSYSEAKDFVIQYITDHYRFFYGTRETKLTKYMLSLLGQRVERNSAVEIRSKNVAMDKLFAYVAEGNNGNKKLFLNLVEEYGEKRALESIESIFRNYMND